MLFFVGVCYPHLDVSNGFCDVRCWRAESESIGSFVPLVHVLLCGLLSLLQKDDLLQGAFGAQANFPHIYHLWWLGWKQPTTFQLLYIIVYPSVRSAFQPRDATSKSHPKRPFHLQDPDNFEWFVDWVSNHQATTASNNVNHKYYQTFGAWKLQAWWFGVFPASSMSPYAFR